MKDRPDKDLLAIDKYTLDDEWQEIADTIFHWCEVLAGRETRLRDLENMKELVEAELKQAIRKRPKSFGCIKVTDAAVKEVMICQDEYQRVVKKINLAKAKVDVLKGFVRCLETKKRGLEKMVDLHGQQYFSMPTTKRARTMMRDLERKEAREKMRKGAEE